MQENQQFTRYRVINHNTTAIEDRHDNVLYVFEPGIPLDIPAEVAAHIFGYTPESGEQDCLTHCMKRFGWNTPDIVKDGFHLMYFNNLDIKPIKFKLVAVSEEPVPDTAPYPGTQGTVMPGQTKATIKGRPKLRAPWPPKYRNPSDPAQTWHGRGGFQPKWMRAALASGLTLADLLISPEGPPAAESA